MGLFNFCKEKCKCRRRCRSWFSLMPEVERGCRNRCNSGDTEFKKQDYLCGGDVDEELLIIAYGYDPCEGGVGIEDVLDPLDTAGDEARDLERYQPVLVVGGALLFLAIIAMVVILTK